MLNGIIQWATLPSCVVGHDISSTSLFIGMELSPLNRLKKNWLPFIHNKSHFLKKFDFILGELVST
jgi:hypothetical protein